MYTDQNQIRSKANYPFPESFAPEESVLICVHLWFPSFSTRGTAILGSETPVLFTHLAAQNYEGTGIFWVRRIGALGGEQAAIKDWRTKRDGTRRGLAELTAP